ncbi:MAG TPA: DNA alkylation repair protein [Oligoflexia bacterium]|nr:DNA alkylation repair protein [Oligoflexia bacterium]HMR24233.1 DNA alkylation repair protein [Oligoflexia bacterium]
MKIWVYTFIVIMDPFKTLYNPKSIGFVSEAIYASDAKFNKKKFLDEALLNLDQLEMKQRVVQIADALQDNLPGTYKQKLNSLLKSVKSDKNTSGIHGFLLWPYTYFIEVYGIDDPINSMKALYLITQQFTSEFGVRPFLERYPDTVYGLFENWVKDPNEHVRRWVSEGLRPNLPWGMKISHINKNLKKNIKLLWQLKNDTSPYVRKSVANHLNDIAALDSQLLLDTVEKWQSNKTNMQALIKSALRNLVKQGHPQALKILGFNPKADIALKKLSISKKKIHEGDSLTISFELINQSKTDQPIMVDYILHYMKKNGQGSPKVFKLKQTQLAKGECMVLSKKHAFKPVTTRKHYAGQHKIEIQVNGQVKSSVDFVLQV